LWALVAAYAGARILQSFPDRVPMLAIVAAHVIPPAAFALFHGRIHYGLRGIRRWQSFSMPSPRTGLAVVTGAGAWLRLAYDTRRA
jgi:hypothetical protein